MGARAALGDDIWVQPRYGAPNSDPSNLQGPRPNSGAMAGAGFGLAVVLGLFVASGALSFQAGKAMAPSTAKQSSWGWIAVPVGLLTGPIGLGIMGVISNN